GRGEQRCSVFVAPPPSPSASRSAPPVKGGANALELRPQTQKAPARGLSTAVRGAIPESGKIIRLRRTGRQAKKSAYGLILGSNSGNPPKTGKLSPPFAGGISRGEAFEQFPFLRRAASQGLERHRSLSRIVAPAAPVQTAPNKKTNEETLMLGL